MSRFFKILIPIILTIAIIACIGWYLFIYDRDFTRDMLLQGARYFENSGNHEVSGWFYDQAYQQADNNDAVAIELAQQHKASGNYTKAEYTLTKAISDGGTAELYIALCKTYIEQDKLLDAVKMLDAVLSEDSSVDPQVRQELQQLRPVAPTCSPSTGFYSQYINVDISAESGMLYVNANGEYPSVTDDPYTESVKLVDGENTLYAIAVSENGLVSPLSIFGYTVGGVVKEVSFADAAMEEAIRLHLEVAPDTVLYTNDLWKMTYFTVPAEAKDISDLSYLTNVEDLAIEAIPSGQLSCLSNLTALTSLQIRNMSVTGEELAVIAALPKLERLTISACSLSTVAGLEKAVNLTYLDLSENTIRDLTPLSALSSLQEVYLQHNAVTTLTSLSNHKLTKLDVSYNLLTELTPIFKCNTLNTLSASNNTLSSVAGIDNLTVLQNLDLSFNKLEDISAVSACTQLQVLKISDNTISDITSLSTLKDLAEFDFSRNSVTELPEFHEDSALVTIDGSHNNIKALTSLGGLKQLNNVYMDYNPKLSSIKPLLECNRLIQVKVYGTKVKDVDGLLEMDVLVEFDPTLAM